jgi:alkanesulfonate monooxygenase SsuD/methylene tetrahydromethanopterin reductase-like flavin-dependent oxidoreductase (luciferase family)
MRFGLGPFTGQVPPDSALTPSRLYEEALSLAERAEGVGFDSVWVSEHHFTADGYLPAPLALASALAARTDGLEVGTALALAPLYEPVRLAEDAAVVDNVARGTGGDGRFTLGLGLGYRDVEYEGVGVERRERVGRLLDVVDTCRAAWGGDPLGPGRVVDYPPVTVTPRPASDVPILVGAMAPAALRRTARVGDGYLVPPSVMLDDLTEKLEVIADELAAQDRDPAEFPLYMLRYGFADEAGETAAWETMRDPYRYLRRKYLEWFTESADSGDTPSEADLDEMAAENDAKWRSWAICGDGDDWVEALRPYEACWPGQVTAIVQLRYPGMSYETARRSVEYVGETVIPELGG